VEEMEELGIFTEIEDEPDCHDEKEDFEYFGYQNEDFENKRNINEQLSWCEGADKQFRNPYTGIYRFLFVRLKLSLLFAC